MFIYIDIKVVVHYQSLVTLYHRRDHFNQYQLQLVELMLLLILIQLASIIVKDFLKNPILKGWTISKIINQTGVDGALSLAKYSNNLASFKTDTGLEDADLKVIADQREIADENNILESSVYMA
jgi:hypothetical protein